MRLSARLSFGLALSLMLILIAQWFVMRHVFSDIATQQLVKKLSQDSEHLLANLNADANGMLTLEAGQLQAMYQRPFSGDYFVIATNQQSIASRSLWDAPLTTPFLKTGETKSYSSAGPQNQRLQLVSRGYFKYQQIITITVAEDVSAFDASLRQFEWWYGWISASILLLLLLLQYLIVRFALQPLKAVEQNVVQIAEGQATTISAAGPAEITPLITEFNRLLLVMQRQSQRSRKALGNLAHALKTQLAVINQALVNDVNTNAPILNAQSQTPTILQTTVKNATDAMQRIVTRELKKARLQADVVVRKRVNLQDAITPLIKTLAFIHQDKNPVIHCDIAPHKIRLNDQEAFSELLGNVLDNACKWCTQNVYLSVKIWGDKNPDGLEIIIADDGVGCDKDALENLKIRGFRLDESTPGSGLGLAIVQDIVDNLDGTVAFSHSIQHGGLQVHIKLPQGS